MSSTATATSSVTAGAPSCSTCRPSPARNIATTTCSIRCGTCSISRRRDAAISTRSSAMPMAESAERQVRAVVDRIAAAIRDRDVDAVMAHYAPDILVFDLLPPLQYRGAAMIRERLSQWLSSFQGPIGFDMRELAITAGDDVAFCHSLNRVSGTTRDG